jgi:hypothetical protein
MYSRIFVEPIRVDILTRNQEYGLTVDSSICYDVQTCSTHVNFKYIEPFSGSSILRIDEIRFSFPNKLLCFARRGIT